MSKTTIFVASGSIIIIVLFIVFSYLMSIVDPDIQFDNSTVTKTGEMSRRLSPQSGYLYPNDELSFKDSVHYGLEKVPEDYDFKTAYGVDNKLSTEFEKKSPIRIPVVKVRNEIQSDGHKSVTLMILPVKDNKRTIREKRPKDAVEESKNVILKIVDDSGQARMEVVVDSGQLNKKKFGKIKKKLSNHNDIYEIKPNNTLLFDMNDQSLVIIDNVAVNSVNNSFNFTTRALENVTKAVTINSNLVNLKSFDKINTSTNNTNKEINTLTKNDKKKKT